MGKLKNELIIDQEAEYAWLVFVYGQEIVDNILKALDNNKGRELKVPKRYVDVTTKVVDFYNRRTHAKFN